jgi:hypothetical protein
MGLSQASTKSGLKVFEDNVLLAGNSILINVVPMPAASAMAGLGLIAVGTRRRR